MRHFLLPLIAVFCSIFMTSCGEDNPILGVKDVTKADLTTPLFFAYDNTLDKDVKKIWAFNDTEAAKGTITVVGDNILRINTEWYYDIWTYSGSKLTLGKEENKRTYDLKKVTVLGYDAISFGTTYVCTPSSNKSIDGVAYESNWYSRGLTDNAFWDAIRKSKVENTDVDITLTK